MSVSDMNLDTFAARQQGAEGVTVCQQHTSSHLFNLLESEWGHSTTLGPARQHGGAQPTTTKQKLALNAEMLSHEALRKIQRLGDQHSRP